MYVYNDPIFKEHRRDLRKNQTGAEKILWSCLRNKGLKDFKFFRQYSVGPYILDFFCPAARLAIELDGEHHAQEEIRVYDEERSSYLKSHDITTLRFWNDEVVENIESVIEQIANQLFQSSPPLSVRGGRGS